MLGFGLFGRIWVRIGPKGDEALRMGRGGMDVWTDGRTYGRRDGQIPPVFHRTSSPSEPLPKKKEKLCSIPLTFDVKRMRADL